MEGKNHTLNSHTRKYLLLHHLNLLLSKMKMKNYAIALLKIENNTIFYGYKLIQDKL